MFSRAQVQRLRQRQQQHEIRFEKDRNGEQITAGKDGVTSPLFAEEREETPHNFVCGPAFHQTQADDGSQRDDHANFPRSFAKAIEGQFDGLDPMAFFFLRRGGERAVFTRQFFRQNSRENGSDDEREERMDSQPADQSHNNCEADAEHRQRPQAGRLTRRQSKQRHNAIQDEFAEVLQKIQTGSRLVRWRGAMEVACPREVRK